MKLSCLIPGTSFIIFSGVLTFFLGELILHPWEAGRWTHGRDFFFDLSEDYLPETNIIRMTGWKIHNLKMYFLLNMRIFECSVSFQGCTLPETNSSHLKNRWLEDDLASFWDRASFQVTGAFAVSFRECNQLPKLNTLRSLHQQPTQI